MTSELIRVEPLPIRTPGAAAEEPLGSSAPVLRLTCPSCSAELTSMVDHAIAPAADGKVSPLKWTTDATVVAATLKALRTSVAATPSVEAPTPAEGTSSSPKAPHLRLVAPPLNGVAAVETPEPTVVATVEAEDPATIRPQAIPTRRRRQGFFSRVLTVRTFRVERDVARGVRDHDAAVTAILDGAASEVLSLHHHRLPGRRAEVAHVSIGASGVFVIDARHLKRASRDLAGEAAGAAGSDDNEDARVADAIATIRAQVAALRSALAAVELHDVRVEGLLCPGGKNVPAPRPASDASEVRVVALDDLTSLVTVAGPLTQEDRVTLVELLKTQLTPSR